MKRKTITLTFIIVITISTIAQAQLYRCIENGRTIFTDMPCDGSAPPMTKQEQQKQIDTVQYSSPKNDHTYKRQNSDTKAEQVDPHVVVKLEIKYQDLIEETKRNQKRLSEERAILESKLAALKHKKEYANNNLAGAVWEDSISKEMEAVTEMHKERIEHAKKLLDEKRAEKAAAKAELSKYKEVLY